MTEHWTRPGFTLGDVGRAGQALVEGKADEQALEIVNNWRSSHAFPLNTFRMGLWQRIRADFPKAIIAQRIKRLPSIKLKLERNPTMYLPQMQDIGGCRAVLPSVPVVREVAAGFPRRPTSRFHHKFQNEKNYIQAPKTDGYRSHHLIYRFQSPQKPQYNGLRIEVQLRSQPQHLWATAVETVGTLTKQSIKASRGTPEWHRFFALMSSALAVEEGAQTVPGTPTDARILEVELRKLVVQLDVFNVLTAYREALQQAERRTVSRAKYFLLDLRPAEHSVSVREFTTSDLGEATKAYLELETSLTGPGAEAVLVSVGSLQNLRAAYPNYFLDTEAFLQTLKRMVQE